MAESPDLTKLSCGCLMEVTDRPGELRIHMHTQCEAHAIQLHGATINPACVHHGSDVVRAAYRAGLLLTPWQVELAELSLAARRQGIPLNLNHTRRSRHF